MSYNITDNNKEEKEEEKTQKHMTATARSHINGSPQEILDRYCVAELCKGWPVYRDAAEWDHFRHLFAEGGAWVFTTWSGGLPIDDFIQVSKEGRAKGEFITHRENGTLVDLDPVTNRAVGKMKATISQRFTVNVDTNKPQSDSESTSESTFDVECDCRFIFFCKKPSTSVTPNDLPGRRDWKIQYVKLFYEKDRIIPIDGHGVPRFHRADLLKYPVGYQYLGLAQSMLGYKVRNDLPTMRNESSQAFRAMYEAMERWLRAEPGVADLLGVPAGGSKAEPRF